MKRDNTRDIPLPAIREELGGGYYYRCPVTKCNKIVRSEWNFCPICGQCLSIDKDSYTEGFYSRTMWQY